MSITTPPFGFEKMDFPKKRVPGSLKWADVADAGIVETMTDGAEKGNSNSASITVRLYSDGNDEERAWAADCVRL